MVPPSAGKLPGDVNAAELPFVEWEGAVVRVDPVRLEGFVLQRLHEVERVQWVHLDGEGDRLRIEAVVRVGWFSVPVAVEASELRVMAGWFGCRLLRVEAPGGVGVPWGVIRWVLGRLRRPRVRVVGGTRIVLVEIGPYLPEGVSASLEDLRMTGGALRIVLGPGAVRDLPA